MTPGTSPSSVTRAVLDSSAVLRALVDGHSKALEWIDPAASPAIELCWTPLFHLEVANALLVQQRAAGMSRARGELVLRAAAALPGRSFRIEPLTEAVWALALERRLSAYDASSVVLAELLDAPLVTADRRLAAATANAILISH